MPIFIMPNNLGLESTKTSRVNALLLLAQFGLGLLILEATRKKYLRNILVLIDTHAHIHFEEFSEDLDDVFANAKKSDVESIISVGVDELDSKKALEFIYNPDNQKLAG